MDLINYYKNSQRKLELILLIKKFKHCNEIYKTQQYKMEFYYIIGQCFNRRIERLNFNKDDLLRYIKHINLKVKIII